jgi:hypothetical protein
MAYQLGTPFDNIESAREYVKHLLATTREAQTEIETELRRVTNGLPGTVGADLVRRYSFIGARLDRLHKILFGVTYKDDLGQLGDGAIWQHLEKVGQRNAFMHGNPQIRKR